MSNKTQMRIVGIGNAGVAILKDIAALDIGYAELVAIDTDKDNLENLPFERTLSLAKEGTGGDTNIAKESAIKHLDELQKIGSESSILVLIAGLGGGTGSIIAPMLSKLARENEETTILSFSIMPLSIEGASRASLARRATAYMRKRCNAVFELPNDIILARSKMPMKEAFEVANSNAVKSIAGIVKMLSSKGIVNIDIATLKKIFSGRGNNAFIGYGTGSGENAVAEAIENIDKSSLLDSQNLKVENILINLFCGEKFEMNRMQNLLESVSEKFGVSGRTAFGVVIEPSFEDKIEVCLSGISVSEDKENENLTSPVEKESSSEADKSAGEKISPQASLLSAPEIVPAPEVSAISKAPKLAEPDEDPKKKRKSFFSFGRTKQSDTKSASNTAATETAQAEFGFVGISEQRGFFENTPPNLRDNVDLDIPTFMRKGIKIK